MSYASYNPQVILDALRAREWKDNSEYQALYQVALEDQYPVVRLAENLRRWNIQDGPAFRQNMSNTAGETRSKIEQQFLIAVGSQDTAYARRLLDAFILLDKEPIQWRFTTLVLACFGAIHIRNTTGRQDSILLDVNDLVIAWQRKHRDRTSVDSSQWTKALKDKTLYRALSAR